MKYFLVLAFLICSFKISTAQLELVSSNIPTNSTSVPINQQIILEFNQSLDPATTLNSILVTSNLRGVIEGNINSLNKRLTFSPSGIFYFDEEITLTVLKSLKSTSLIGMNKPTAIRFTTVAKPSLAKPPAFIDFEFYRDINQTQLSASTAADIDGDGDIDILNGSNLEITWLENIGNGNYQSKVISTKSSFMYEVKVVDLDNDGDNDFLIATIPELGVFINDGNQNFSYKVVRNNVQCLSVDVADFDSDGFLDIIYSDITQNISQTFLLHNQRDNNFTSEKISETRAYKNRILDIDFDGDWDIIQYDDLGLRCLLNLGTNFEVKAVSFSFQKLKKGSIKKWTFPNLILAST